MNKRITPLQKKIFDAHLVAAKNDFRDIIDLKPPVEPMKKEDKLKILRDALLEGKIVPSFWKEIWVENVSITSQLIASPKVLNSGITKSAEKIMRDKFKFYLRMLKIE